MVQSVINGSLPSSPSPLLMRGTSVQLADMAQTRQDSLYPCSETSQKARVYLSLWKGRGAFTPVITGPSTWSCWVLPLYFSLSSEGWEGRNWTSWSFANLCCFCWNYTVLQKRLQCSFFSKPARAQWSEPFSSTLAGVAPGPNLSWKCRICFIWCLLQVCFVYLACILLKVRVNIFWNCCCFLLLLCVAIEFNTVLPWHKLRP